ncbi:MAG: nucleoside kinase [Clostridia bacterium]|nr:nucleoside kinase [Clostridia bacterium]
MEIQYQDKIIETKENVTIQELLKEEIEKSQYPVIGAIFNNEYVNLGYPIKQDGEIKLIDLSSKEGTKIYRRTIIYILEKAVEEVCPNKKIIVNYQLPNSMFCEIEQTEITEELIQKLDEKMRQIVKKDIPIKQVIMTRKQAEEFYQKNDISKGRLQLDQLDNQEIYMYYCEDYYNYCYGTIANRTGTTKNFEIIKYEDGFLVRYPSSDKPKQLPKLIETKKLAWALNEYDDIHKILNVNTVYKLNKAMEEGQIKDIIMLDEALHEKKIANIADKIAQNRKVKMILIAGPSSSGKTTFAQRLGIQLRINRIKPVTISVDNYFVERKETPRDKNGNLDFECIEAIDLELFNDHLTKLLNGEEIEMPEFDFHEGTKRYNGKKLKLEADQVLVIEGIHCLNDKLTSKIAKDQKYKIYISALTVLNMDRYNRISTTDTRLVRRIVRDYQFRGYDAKHTLASWHMVNNGEEKNIFPYQEEANSIFNTSLIYELGVLKGVVMPLLEEIKQQEPEYAEARRLINMLKYFETIPPEYVPTNSLLKEFLGGGDFKY